MAMATAPQQNALDLTTTFPPFFLPPSETGSNGSGGAELPAATELQLQAAKTSHRSPRAPKPANERKKQSKRRRKGETEENHGGCVHVRARRGQATDSHSLAERVRRERISVRMRQLQGLVPGCEKVTGKALMLDEIINYVQSLQYQVEFLSMRIASLCPIIYDFGLDLAEMQEMDSIVPTAMSSEKGTCHIKPSPITSEAENSYSIMDNPVPFLLHRQGLPAYIQDNNQAGVQGMRFGCSFQ